MAKALAGLVVGMCLGAAFGWVSSSMRNQSRIDRTVAIGWDGERSFYGAHVYLEPLAAGYSVRGRVYIGRGDGVTDYFHELGELGTASTDAEAVQRWGDVRFAADGLHIGDFFMPKAKLQTHR